MSAFLWKTSWETGIGKIDGQHKELFEKVNLLVEALQNQDARLDLLGMLVFLAGYVDNHFRDEETAMKATNYPGLAGHRIVHEKMRQQVGDLIAQIRANHSVLTSYVVQFLMHWLINHMEGEDCSMAAYLKKCDLSQLDLDAASP